MSLGFAAAGCEISAAVEFDPDAARSHGTNFHPGAGKHAVARDITQVGPRQLTAELGLGSVADAFDVIIGGPPCQAFARVGRSKLREVADHPEAFRHDARARLYIEYLRYVDACEPLAVVIENVPDMLNHGGHNLAEEIAEVLESRGYRAVYTLLNAAFYGVPQMRERMFLTAIREELVSEIYLPAPSHWIELPAGYEGTRAVALKSLRGQAAEKSNPHYVSPPAASKDLPKAVTAKEALQDLPIIDARAEMDAGSLKRGARKFDTYVKYTPVEPVTEYGLLMRTWRGFTGRDFLADHVIRYLPRDYALFARLEAGDQYPEAVAVAEKMFEEALKEVRMLEGRRPRKGSKRWKALRASIVPPYDPNKFPNKWRKMEPDYPARTLLAHLGKDGYTHIHYDSDQARTISVREAARLQSFPDGFVFCGTMNPAFRQIGNAVPPLLAKAVAGAMLNSMAEGLEAAPEAQVAAGGN